MGNMARQKVRPRAIPSRKPRRDVVIDLIGNGRVLVNGIPVQGKSLDAIMTRVNLMIRKRPKHV